MQILTIAGSLRQGSLNRATLRAARSLVPEGMQLREASIRDLPLYDADLDVDGGPPPVQAFKRAIAEADGLLIATPEYNYGIPGPLKNALDWASRPAYRSVLAHKPVALLSASAAQTGGVRAQGQLKQVMLGVLAEVFPHPEFALGGARDKFDEDLKLTDESTRRRLAELLEAYGRWLGPRLAGGSARGPR